MKTRFDNAYVLNVLSDDHPGIVACVSGVISGLGGNIDACSQTVVGGYFTQILVVSLPKAIDPDELADKVQASRTGNGCLQVMGRPFIPAPPPSAEPVDRFVITALGTDKPGIINRISQYLASKDINIEDLYWDVQVDQCVLISQVEIPKHWDLRMLQADLDELCGEQGLAVRIQHENVFVATNQLRMAR